MVVSLTRMNHILEIDMENATVRTEAGVITADLQAAVEKVGLFYPPDPSSIKHSTIGGNIACNAGGPRCLKYGVTGDYVLGLTVVLADGRILKTGGKPIKDVTGYDLNGLFTGSEGTLGLITEALLRLVARPRYAKTALAEFASLHDASRTVNAILMAGIVPASLELMDQTAIVCIEEAMHLGLNINVAASLIIETDGADEQTTINEIEACGRICKETGAQTVKLAQNETERASLWKARRSISPPWHANRPTSLARILPCRAAPSLKWSSGCGRSAPGTDYRSSSLGMQAMEIFIPTFSLTNAIRSNGTRRRKWSPKSSMPRWLWAGRSRANMASGCSSVPIWSRPSARYRLTCSATSSRRSIH